jgi:peptide/nickel transport system substrate-binding protein
MKLLKALLVMGVVMVLVGACGPAATPSPAVVEKTVVVEVEKTVVVEKEVEVTKVVEKEVEVVVTATPEPTTPPTPAPTGPKRGGTLHVSFAEWPKNLHNQIDSGTEGVYVQVNMRDALLNIDANGNIVPGLAKELPEMPDDVTYIFQLREGVKFHNGTDFDCDDVLYTYDRLLGKIEGEKSTQAPRYSGHMESVECLDKYTVKITLKAPWEDFINLMAFDKYQDMLSREAVEELGDDYGLTGAVGTGPFKFKEWVKGDHITLVRNEDYWGEPPYLDEIVYKAIPEESTRILSFLTGETDLMLDPPLKDVAALDEDPKVRVLRLGPQGAGYLPTRALCLGPPGRLVPL